MNVVPPPITGFFKPTSTHDDGFDESHMTYGKKSHDLLVTDFNDFVAWASSNKSSELKAHDYDSCDSSEKSSKPKSDEFGTTRQESSSQKAVKEGFLFNNVSNFSCFQ